MTTSMQVTDFIRQRRLAVVGVSRSGKKFGNFAYRELKAKGYQLFPVNPKTEIIDGDRCYPSLNDLPGPVDGVLIAVPPAETERVLRQVQAAGIGRVWMQQGAESPQAVRFCEENGIQAVHGECILMFAEPTASYHRLHRWVWKILGKLPR